MLEDPSMSRFLRMPQAGVADVAAGAAAGARRRPSIADDCMNLYESVGFWNKVMEPEVAPDGTPLLCELGQPRPAFGAPSRGFPSHNIVVVLGVDAFLPYKRGGVSLTPFLLQVVNLPEGMRVAGNNFILAGVVPGKKGSSTNSETVTPNLHTYVKQLVDDLNELWANGFEYACPYWERGPHVGCDAAPCTERHPCAESEAGLGVPHTHRVRVKLLYTVCDYPGHAALNCQQHQMAYCGCQKCDVFGKHIGSIVYQGFGAPRPQQLTHAEYLERGRKLLAAQQVYQTALVLWEKARDRQRKGLRWYKNRREPLETGGHRRNFPNPSADKVKATVAALRIAKIAASKELTRVRKEESRNVKGRSALCDLPYFDIVEDTPLDMMHINKNVAESIVKLLKFQRVVTAAKSQAAKKTERERKAKAKRQSAKSIRHHQEAVSVRIAAAAIAADSDWLDDDTAVAADPGDVSSPEEDSDLDDDSEHEEVEVEAPAEPGAVDVMEDIDGDLELVVGPLDEDGGGAAGAAAAASTPRSDVAERRNQRARFCVSEPCYRALETHSYDAIEAPTAVAPASKHPFVRTGDMTSHDWIGFTRCYGKYLLQQQFERVSMRAPASGELEHPDHEGYKTLCALLEFLELCLRGHVTAAVKVRIAELLPELEARVGKYLPEREHTIVIHTLLYHIPATLNRWGPARGTWAFPFERYVARLV
jgi:hypothetical protein